MSETETKTWRPEKKVVASAGSGAVVALIVWAASLVGVDMPVGVAEGIIVLVVAVAGWLAPHTERGNPRE